MKKENSLQSFCERQDRMYLLQEWDQKKNAPLTPNTVHKGSHQKVWWHCENGHTWYSEIRVRANGSMCPYCTRRMLWVESNDLLTLNPALASEWDNEKNGELKPSDVLEGSHKYVWWKCQNGHSWRARILSRSRGAGCPVCTGKAVMSGENDLATLFPDIAAQWDTERNGSLRPDQVTSFSNRKVWRGMSGTRRSRTARMQRSAPATPSAPETSARSTAICIFRRRRMQNGGAHETEFL